MLTNNRVKKLTLAINSALLASSLAITSTALAQTNETTAQALNENTQNSASQTKNVIAINISAGSLSQVLSQFSGTIGVALSFDADLLAGKKSAGITGNYSSQQTSVELGFNQLLIGSGYHISYLGNNNYKLVVDNIIATLATTQVTGAQETATSRLEGYVATRSATGTKTDTPLIETPQTISVVGANEINIRKAQNLMDVLGYTAGVAWSSGAFNNTTDIFQIRGFSGSEVKLDGKRSMANVFAGTIEPYGVERIEVLKGAASLLYGANSPGGIINAVTKRPTTESIAEVGLELGSFNRKQVTVDLAGALPETNDWSYRLTVLERESNSFIDHVPDDKTYIAPALKWQISADTSLTLLSHYQKKATVRTGFVPIEGSLLPNPNGKLPRNFFNGEPGQDADITENTSVAYFFEHRFTDQLSVHHSSNYTEADVEKTATFSWGLQDDKRTIQNRLLQQRKDNSSVISSDSYINYRLPGENVSHNIIAGFEVSHLEHQTKSYGRALGGLDMYAPVYGKAIGEAKADDWSWQDKTGIASLYLQDQIKWQDKWLLLVGLRQEWFEFTGGLTFPNTYDEKEKTDALTGNAGLVYLADNGLAPFISYSQSFEFQSGKSFSQERFKPTEGEQIEAGIRYQPDHEGWLLSATTYQLVQSNVTTTDPSNPNFEIQTGEVTSKGVEIEFKGQLTDYLQLTSAYSYTDARNTKTNIPEDLNLRNHAVPYNQLSLWADYQLTSFDLPGLTLGAGVRYVGATLTRDRQHEVAAFTIIDAMLSYQHSGWRYALNVSNLTDKTYIVACSWDCSYGEGRKIIASVNYSF